ncbi:3'(2'),5'-bisphosphate nucleotidase CysQ [Ginsengibacter hankyongi]|uniref:3'(2'),5'-bisphosphate nucleotidase CysQ n=1 Tax=Ginsengibacter hankyongi TaxID=2607284 RepID=A0A5J5IFM0_9BACT|nr:3'(2'),5'-bisphosphate nucleotidase CysQ [Ginsengibacter hankyongi]KAA9035648.1 3'(2'),5'-bisphosphate nucleotidase CysQ [Ginsengibacter hankyongi]
MDIKPLMQIAEKAAFEAGKAIMDVYGSSDFSTELKNNKSPVTKADKNAHQLITEYLKETHLSVLSEEGSDTNFLERRSWEYFWLIDPLDGTKEFINKNGEFTVNIALLKQNKPLGGIIYRPSTGTLYTGSKETGVYKIKNGTQTQLSPLTKRTTFDELLKKDCVRIVASRSHPSPETKLFADKFKNVTLLTMGSALKFMLLLENEADIYPRYGTTMEWDTAAAHAILNASNRGVYQLDLRSELMYNKPDLRNPFFISF